MNRLYFSFKKMAVVCLFFSGMVFAKPEKIPFCATVAWVEGEANNGSGATLNLGQKLSVGDWIVTQEDSRVKLLLKDDSVIDI